MGMSTEPKRTRARTASGTAAGSARAKPRAKVSSGGPARRKAAKKPSPGLLRRCGAKVLAVPGLIKRGTVQAFIGISVLSATFPSAVEGMSQWVSGTIKANVDPTQWQSLINIPILSDILKRAGSGGEAATAAAGTHSGGTSKGHGKGVHATATVDKKTTAKAETTSSSGIGTVRNPFL